MILLGGRLGWNGRSTLTGSSDMEHEERLKAALADRYEIEHEIGAGGMATVYLAQDLKHNRQVAVKVLDPNLAQSLGAERFLREIETAANLAHPHILPLFDSGETDGFLFYVMPFVEGESLRSRLTKEKQLPVEDAIQIAREIAGALAHAHEKGVIHRDVKPANIMLEAGHAVLADFGVAHAVAEAKEERITRTGTSLGTPSYMSPEQASGEQDLDGRSDQYALGCMLYEMLAGHPPFTGAQAESVVRQHLVEDPPLVTRTRPSVSEGVERVINRALAKNPADRFRTTGEMAAALALTTSPVKANSRWGRTKAVVYAGTVILGLATAAVIASRWGSGGPEATVEDDRLSIAVLPFQDNSPDPEQAYFAGGVQEEILSTLQEISAFRVISRTSVMQYEENRPTSREIAELLGVSHLVEGSAQVSGGRVRLTVHLIDALRDEPLWSEDYDRELTVENLFEVRSEVGRQIAFQVGVNLTPDERNELAEVLTDNTEAYLTFMQGNEAFVEERARGNSNAGYRSIELYELAIGFDPNFALARARLALSLSYTTSDAERYERARAEADRALELVPGLAEARVALGRYHLALGQPEDAMLHFQVAEKESKNLYFAALQLGLLQRRLGEYEAAIATLERARESDPRNLTILQNLTMSYLVAHRYGDALLTNAQHHVAQPSSSTIRRRAWLHFLTGNAEDARLAVQELFSYNPVGILFPLPALQSAVLSRLLNEEDERSALSAYTTVIDSPCREEIAFCLRIALLYEQTGSKARAAAYWDSLRIEMTETPPERWSHRSTLALTYQGLGERTLAIEAAEALVRMNGAPSEGEFEDQFQYGPSGRILLARILAHFDEPDRAIDILEKELPAPSMLSVPILEIDPIWDPLRNHPRFQALLEKYADDVEH